MLALVVARDGSGLVSLNRITPMLGEPRCTLRWNPFLLYADKVELQDSADCESTRLALVEGVVLIALWPAPIDSQLPLGAGERG